MWQVERSHWGRVRASLHDVCNSKHDEETVAQQDGVGGGQDEVEEEHQEVYITHEKHFGKALDLSGLGRCGRHLAPCEMVQSRKVGDGSISHITSAVIPT